MVEEKHQEGTSSVCSDYSFSTGASEVTTDEPLKSFTLLPNCGSSPTDSEAFFCYYFSPSNIIRNDCIIPYKTCTQNCHECTVPCSQNSGGVCMYDPSICPERDINDSHLCHGLQLVCSAEVPCFSCTAYYPYGNKNCMSAPPLKCDFNSEVVSPSRRVVDVDEEHSHGNSLKNPSLSEGTFAVADNHTVNSTFIYPGCPSYLHRLKGNDGGSKRCNEKSNEKSSGNCSSPAPACNSIHSSEAETLHPFFSSLGFYGLDGCWYPLQDMSVCNEAFASVHSSSQYGPSCSEQYDMPDAMPSSPLVYQGHPQAYHIPPALYWGFNKPCTFPLINNKIVYNTANNSATHTSEKSLDEKGLDDKNPKNCCIKENEAPEVVQASSTNGYDLTCSSKNIEKKPRSQGRPDTILSSTKNMYPVYNLYQRLDLPHDFLGRPKLLCSVPVEGKLSVEEVWVYHMQLLFKNLPHTWTIHYSEAGTRFLGNWGMFKDHAKVRFYCKECNDGWTSMYGIVVFMYRQNFDYGEIQYQMVGQKCSHCHPAIFEMPLWYPEEAQKVITNLYYEISSKIYGLHTPRTIRTRRLGQPHTQHNHQLCQGCYSGVCRLSNKPLLFEV